MMCSMSMYIANRPALYKDWLVASLLSQVVSTCALILLCFLCRS